eukprot:jgi/Picre1/29931/NNA_005309.t1
MGYRGGSRGRGRKGRGGGGSRRDRPVHEPEYIENRDGSSSSVGDESDTSSSSGEAFGVARRRGRARWGQARGRAVLPGDLPPMSSDEEDEDEPRAPQPVQKNRRELEEERKMQEEMDRLRLIREKREKQRLQRIEEEGWDRFAPLTDDNHPPGTAPPSQL